MSDSTTIWLAVNTALVALVGALGWIIYQGVIDRINKNNKANADAHKRAQDAIDKAAAVENETLRMRADISRELREALHAEREAQRNDMQQLFHRIEALSSGIANVDNKISLLTGRFDEHRENRRASDVVNPG